MTYQPTLTHQDNDIMISVVFDKATTEPIIDAALAAKDQEVTEEHRNWVYRHQAACHLILNLAGQLDGDADEALKSLLNDLYVNCKANLLALAPKAEAEIQNCD